MRASLLYQDFLAALLDGDCLKCTQLFNESMMWSKDFYISYELLIRNAMYEVGDLWQKNKLSVAEEHIAASTAELLLDQVYPKIVALNRQPFSVVVACTEGEYHLLGSKMVSHIFEHAGWRCYYLGSNTPVNDLLSYVIFRQPEVLALSLTLFWHIDRLVEILEVLTKNYPAIKILLGGQAFRHEGTELFKQYPAVQYIADLTNLNSFILDFKNNRAEG